MAAYTCKFEELCHFLRMCQGAPELYEGWMCMKYQDGLRDDIRQDVAPFEIKHFAELVNKSRVVEECSKRSLEVKDNRGGFYNRGREGPSFKRSGHTPQSYQGWNNHRRNGNHQGNGKGRKAMTPSEDLRCPKCRNSHPDRPCRKGSGLCYSCGRTGHLSWNCPHKKNHNACGAQQSGRMYTVVADDAAGSGALNRAKCGIIIDNLVALCDMEALYYFVTYE